MENKINKQLSIIERAISWVTETESMQGAKGETAYSKLVNFRRSLNKKKYALEGNPAAALYGESQVGKSYLISSLLSEEGSSLNIEAENNIKYNFIEEINPPGGDSESTSLVCRFSAKYKPVNPQYPIKAVLLSPADIVLVLCDSFYSDIRPNHDLMLKSEDIDSELTSLKERIQNQPHVQEILGEDEILDIKDYFENNLSKGGEVLSSNFFSDVSLLISKAKPDEWKDIFSLLWNKNKKFTALFTKLISEYEKLNFANIIYLPIESVLYKHGTLLDVKRLKEIYFENDKVESAYQSNTNVLFYKNENEYNLSVTKSTLCALTAELIFSQPESLSNNKSFLKETDLLDFPGARSRLTKPENLIEEEIIHELLLRGKVSFLFNKYIDCEKINILLFCAKHGQPAQRAMPELLNNWINKVIGDSPEIRADFINKSKVAPLFVVGTFFNVNLQYNQQQDRPDENTSFKYRWNQRFVRTLKEQLLDTETYNWFENWTTNQPNFQNIFLLRDFEKSESISHIFKGYIASKKELEEVIPEKYPDFKKNLRQSFLEHDFVLQHFKNPSESWDKAASINQDGTSLIIDNLTIAANNINPARHSKLVNELNNLNDGITYLLKDYYNSSDKADSLLKAIATAGRIQANLDIAFGRNPYFFGSLMKELMLNNSDVYQLFVAKISDIEQREIINMDKYSAIRMRVTDLNPNDSFDTNLEYLRKQYEMESTDQCRNFFENEQGIDLNELFFGNNERVKSLSQILAKELQVFWFDHYMLKNQQNLNEVFSEEGLFSILDMLRRLYEKLNVTDVIADRIRRYVDGYRNIEDVYEMIADISAEMINKFINSVGLEYYNESNFADLNKASDNINGLTWDHKELQFDNNNKSEVADLITQMDNLSELLNQNPLPKEAKRLPNYSGYIRWYDLLKAGFVTASGVPNYDPVANGKLGAIINELKVIEN